MWGPYEPYIPQTKGELIDQLGSMMLGAPRFIDRTGYFPTSVETEFKALNGGLDIIRARLGEERFALVRAMSDRMRALFEADPDDRTGQTDAGRDLIDTMQRMLGFREFASVEKASRATRILARRGPRAGSVLTRGSKR